MQVQQKVGAKNGEHVRFGKALGTRRILSATDTGGTFGLVEQDLPAGQLGSPVHTHEREDEYSYVLSGRLSAQVGDNVIEAGPGELVVKPRRIPHAFWNATDEETRLLEVISPGGFEQYFAEMAPLLNAQGPPDVEAIGEVQQRYALSMDRDSIAELSERFGLRPPG